GGWWSTCRGLICYIVVFHEYDELVRWCCEIVQRSCSKPTGRQENCGLSGFLGTAQIRNNSRPCRKMLRNFKHELSDCTRESSILPRENKVSGGQNFRG